MSKRWVSVREGKNSLLRLLLTISAIFMTANSQVAFAEGNALDPKLVSKANEIHLEAMGLLDKDDPYAAITKERAAAELLPKYWLPHAGLTYLYFGRGGAALDESESSVSTPHPELADLNRAIVLQSMAKFSDALKIYQAVLAKDEKCLVAKVGAAACLLNLGRFTEGKVLVDAAYADAPDDVTLLDSIARTYFEFGELSLTEKICNRALALNPTATQTAKLKRLLFVAAVNMKDTATISQLQADIVAKLEPTEIAWYRGNEIKWVKTPEEAEADIKAGVAAKISVSAWRDFAVALEEQAASKPESAKQWQALAEQCLQHADKELPCRWENRLMLAALKEQMKDEAAAISEIKKGWVEAESGDPQNRSEGLDSVLKAELKSVGDAFTADGANKYTSHLTAVEFSLPKVTCHCRYTHYQAAIKTLPGVVDVIVGPSMKQAALLFIDDRLISPKQVFENPTVANLHEEVKIIAEKPMKSISEASELLTQYDEPLYQPYMDGERFTLQRPEIVAAN